MRTACSPNIRALVDRGDPQVNKFEQVFSLDHQMSLAGGPGRGPVPFMAGEGLGGWGPMQHG